MKKVLYSLALIFAIFGLSLTINCNYESLPYQQPSEFVLLSPADQETVVSQSVTLTWEPSFDPDRRTVFYNVYLETSSILESAFVTSYTNSYTVEALEEDVYFWKISASNGEKATLSETWSFTLLNRDSIMLVSPQNSSSVFVDVLLEWKLLSETNRAEFPFDVYLDTNNPPTTMVGSDINELTFQITLSDNTTYYWKVIGKGTDDEIMESEIWSFITQSTAPDEIKLSLPDSGASEVSLHAQLEWQLISETDGTGVTYDVYLDTEPTPTIIVGSGITNLYFDPTLLSNTRYYWKVVGNNDNGGVAESVIWNFSTQINTPPLALILLSPADEAVDIGLNTKLEWMETFDPDGDVISYDVYLDTENPPVTMVGDGITELFFEPTLEAKTTYYWQVICKDEYDGVTPSQIKSFSTQDINFTPGEVVLSSPENEATDVAMDTKMEWQAAIDPDGDELTYDVYLDTNYPPVTKEGSAITELFFEPVLTSGTTYYWKVICSDGHGATSESVIRSFTTVNNPPDAVVLSSPKNGASGFALDASLEWLAASDPEGDVVYYDVYLDSNTPPTTMVSSDLKELTFQPTLLSYTTYYWKVISKDGRGLTNESEIWSFTTISDTSYGVILVSPDDDASDVPLSTEMTWKLKDDPGTAFYQYDLYLDTNDPPTTMVATHLSLASFWPALKSGTTYYWKVIGKDDSSGKNVESAQWKFKTVE